MIGNSFFFLSRWLIPPTLSTALGGIWTVHFLFGFSSKDHLMPYTQSLLRRLSTFDGEIFSYLVLILSFIMASTFSLVDIAPQSFPCPSTLSLIVKDLILS